MNDHPHTDDALRELRISDPAPPDEVLAARRILNAAIEAEKRTGRRTRRSWLAAASSVTAVVVAAAIAVSVTSVRAPSASALMFDLVGVVTRGTSLDPAAGEFVYVRSEGEVIGGSEVTIDDAPLDEVVWRESFVDERWFAEDGSFRLRREAGEPEFFTELEEEIFFLDPNLPPSQSEVFQIDSEPAPLEVDRATLPLETAALRAALVAAYEIDRPDLNRPVEVELAERAADLAVLHDTTPELRGALLALLAETDGLELVDSGLGSITVGVEYDTAVSRDRLELAFDAATGRLIERWTLYVEPPSGSTIPAGPTSVIRYDEPQVVDELGP